jgi:RNA polymerase sigma-70 factor (ECF subfamily)
MTLSTIFLDHLPAERCAWFAERPGLDLALTEIAEAGRRAWPEIRIATTDFIVFLARCLPEGAASELRSLRAGELYLVCAYALGETFAASAIEDRYMRRVEAALSRIGTPAATIADILQELRQRLVEAGAPASDRQGYAGRGDLAAWLCISAVRTAGRRIQRQRRELRLEDCEALLLASPEPGPDVAFLRETYKEELSAAFREALASMTSRERLLLRYHFLDGLSIDRIGTIYRVHRATAARWVNQARDALCTRTLEVLTRRISLSEEGVRRMLSLIESQLSVGLAFSPE